MFENVFETVNSGLAQALYEDYLKDPSKCPLCGRPNYCAMAADPNAKHCWCEEVIFSDELLDRIPKDSVRKTCVCKKCLDEFEET